MSNEPSQGKREGAGALATVRSILSIVVTLLLVGCSAAGLYNLFGMREEVLALASETACEGQAACKAQLLFFEGSPFSFSYRMSTPKGTVSLSCRRPWIFVGAFACKSTDEGAGAAPVTSASAAGSAKAGSGKSTPAPKGSR